MSEATRSCQRCHSANEAGDLRCPICYLPTPQIADSGDSTRLHVFRCKTCGAAVEYNARAQEPQCAFCGSVLELEKQQDPVEQIEHYLPFTVDRRAAVDVCRRWLSHQGWLFRPSNLASATRLESLRALWWVGWVVNADAVVTWTIDSDAGARQAKWAPHAGEFRTAFDGVVIPATRGLSAAECERLIPTYALEHGAEPATNASAAREQFETSRSVARGRIVQRLQRLAEARIKSHEAPGTRFRSFHAAIHLRGLRTRRFAFPAYAIAYRYRGRLYRTVISGQDPACVIGEAPRSIAKTMLIAAVILAGLAAIAIGR
jgi:hypothetical protein